MGCAEITSIDIRVMIMINRVHGYHGNMVAGYSSTGTRVPMPFDDCAHNCRERAARALMTDQTACAARAAAVSPAASASGYQGHGMRWRQPQAQAWDSCQPAPCRVTLSEAAIAALLLLSAVPIANGTARHSASSCG